MKRPRNIVGPRIRALRQERGWSQAGLAAKCQLIGWDISRDVIAGIELRRRWVADAELLILAKVLATSVAGLYPARTPMSEVIRLLSWQA